MRHWLMKSEPDVYSIEDLRRDKVSGWEGVRNYQARNNLRAMRKGDRALFYHSNASPSAIVGEVEVVREAYPDPGQFDPGSDYFDKASTSAAPRWFQVRVRFLRAFPRPLSLDEARRHEPLKEMVLLKSGRLSVQPVTKQEWDHVLKVCS